MTTKRKPPVDKSLLFSVTFAKEAEVVEDIDLDVLTANCLRTYGEEVNLDRSVPDFRDGLKPVTRRTLWALHGLGNQLVKTARLGGETIGKFHPHGEASCYGAITTQVVAPTPPIEGVGNWGSLIDPAGAPRYTNVRMSGFGRTTFFHPDYLPLITKVDNYDGKDREPLFLPASLPNLLLNGIEGIGLGLTTRIPAFTPKSLLPLLADFAEGTVVSDRDIVRRLVPYHEYGGTIVRDKQNFDAFLQLVSTPKSSLRWTSEIQVDEVKKQIHLSKFGPEINPVKLVDAFLKLQPQVATVHTGKGVSYTIQCRKDLNMNEFKQFVERLRQRMTVSRSYDLYITRRAVSKENPDKYDVSFRQVSLRELMEVWVQYRIRMETASIKHQIKLSEERISYYELLLHAVANLDTVFKSLRQADPRAFLVKHLKITPEQADTILNLKVRQLSKLDGEEIQQKLKDEKAHLKSLQAKLKIPDQLVAQFLRSAADKFKLTANDWSTQWVL
jgi:hypothetical protein